MSEHNVYIKEYYSEEIYERTVRDLITNDIGNHIEDRIDGLIDRISRLTELLVDKHVLSMPEIAAACGVSQDNIYTNEGKTFFRTKKINKDHTKTIVSVVKFSPEKPLVSQYSEKLKETVLDEGTIVEMKEKWGDLWYV